MTNARETILPLQPRSGVAASALDDAGEAAVRIRTRGPLARPFPTQDPRSLRALVETLRSEQRSAPLVCVIAGGETRAGSPARRFLDALLPLIDARSDVVWHIAAPSAQPAEAIAGPVVELRGENDIDRRITANVVADLLFVAGESAADEKTLRNFVGRAPFAVVPAAAPRLEKIIAAAAESGLGVLLCDFGDRVFVKPAAVPSSRLKRMSTLSNRKLGEELRKFAFEVAFRHDRRLLFRETLVLHAKGGAWPRRVIEIATKSRWPAWAVQTIPQRYVPFGREDQQRIAFAWQPFVEGVELLPNVKTLESFCGGEIVRVRVTEEVDEFLQELDRTFATYVDRFYSPDHAFFFRASDALDAMASLWEGKYPYVAARMRDVGQRLTVENAPRWSRSG
jgi:hypothetical protein